MPGPPPWPDHPLTAVKIGTRWTAFGVPPAPWPEPGFDYGAHPEFGPPGTLWSMTVQSIIDARSFPGASFLAKEAIDRFLARFKTESPPVTDVVLWVVPLPGAVAPIFGEPMRWIHATIVATLGGNESVAHTLNFRTAPAADVDQDAAALATFAGQIRDKWMAFLGATAGANTVQRYMSPDLVYKEVRAAYLQQDAPAGISTHISRKTGRPVKDFAYPRPAYIVPTQFATFPATGASGNSSDPTLPYEVACCLSLKTAFRGPRNRGRLYLGGLTQTLMAGNGNFQAPFVAGIAAAFDETFLQALNTTTGNDAHVVSRAYNSSVPITGVSAGVVPDSQRRRRRSRLEAYSVASPVLLA